MRVAPSYWVKTLVVNPKEALSLQRHRGRTEQWVVVKGTAFVSLDNKSRVLDVGDSIYIPKDTDHRLINLGDEVLEVVEVAIGDCDEDDIERLEDRYGR